MIRFCGPELEDRYDDDNNSNNIKIIDSYDNKTITNINASHNNHNSNNDNNNDARNNTTKSNNNYETTKQH